MMNGPFQSPTGFSWEDPVGVSGCGGAETYRLTRQSDNASTLLHEVDPSVKTHLEGVTFAEQPPNFNEPFVTRLLGILEQAGQTFLVEAVPPAVSLIDTWRIVLHNDPRQAEGMLRQVIHQLDRLFQKLTDRHERHGAVCAANVILTTSGVYGLLTARLETNSGDIWLRPIPDAAHTSRRTPPPPGPPETLAPILQDLLQIEASQISSIDPATGQPQYRFIKEEGELKAHFRQLATGISR